MFFIDMIVLSHNEDVFLTEYFEDDSSRYPRQNNLLKCASIYRDPNDAMLDISSWKYNMNIAPFPGNIT